MTDVTKDEDFLFERYSFISSIESIINHDATLATQKFYHQTLELLKNKKLSDQEKSENTDFVIKTLKDALLANKNSKPLIKAFEKISVLLEMDESKRRDLGDFLSIYNINCQVWCLNRFLPESQRKETLFDKIDRYPTSTNVEFYTNSIFKKFSLDYFKGKEILYLLDKHKIHNKSQARQTSLFSPTAEIVECPHKKLVKNIIDKYSQTLQTKRMGFYNHFFEELLMQTNFSDKEYADIRDKNIIFRESVDNSAPKRREQDIARLNDFLQTVEPRDIKDRDFFAGYKSLYFSLMYQSLLEGKDVSNVDFLRDRCLQRQDFEKKKGVAYKSLITDEQSKSDVLVQAIGATHTTIDEDTSHKMKSLDEYIRTSKIIDKESEPVKFLSDNIFSLGHSINDPYHQRNCASPRGITKILYDGMEK